MRCRAGRCTFWITWYGKMLSCGMMEEPGTMLNEGGLEHAWQETLRKTREIRLPGKCTKCPWRQLCRSCGAMVYTESGNYENIPEYRCKMVHQQIEEYKKILNTIGEDQE